MILCVFEGERDRCVFDTLIRLFFKHKERQVLCCYNSNIYSLYKKCCEYESGCDIVAILREMYETRDDNPFSDDIANSDIAEVFLFFDIDFHDSRFSVEEKIEKLDFMLNLFNDETDMGKLYVSYPMLEALRYTKYLPDAEFFKYKIFVDECVKFKGIANDFSDYASDFLELNFEKEIKKEKYNEVRDNWNLLKEQNVKKANWICCGENVMPLAKGLISQDKILINQIEKFIKPKNSIAILAAFPLFLYEYFK